MVSFHHITLGEQTEFNRVLAKEGKFTAEDVRRIINNPSLAAAMHAAIADITPTFPWYVTPELQLERARQLWPNIELPEPPKEFKARTKSEVLLLHVPDSFNSLWDKVAAPEGYTKYREEEVRSMQATTSFVRPVWVAFDPEHRRGDSPESLQFHPEVASYEVFSALIQFPQWSLAWLDGAAAPNLSGFVIEHNGRVPSVPYLSLSSDNHQLQLCIGDSDEGDEHFASPSVRKCYYSQ